METATKKNKPKVQLTLEEAAGNGPMMVWAETRSEEEVKFMSDWAKKRKVELAENKEDCTQKVD